MTTVHVDPEAIKSLLRDLSQGPRRGRSLTRGETRYCPDEILAAGPRQRRGEA